MDKIYPVINQEFLRLHGKLQEYSPFPAVSGCNNGGSVSCAFEERAYNEDGFASSFILPM